MQDARFDAMRLRPVAVLARLALYFDLHDRMARARASALAFALANADEALGAAGVLTTGATSGATTGATGSAGAASATVWAAAGGAGFGWTIRTVRAGVP